MGSKKLLKDIPTNMKNIKFVSIKTDNRDEVAKYKWPS